MTDQNQKRSELVVNSLCRFVRHGAVYHVINLLRKSHPADIARAFSFCSLEERHFLWGVIPSLSLKAEILTECDANAARSFLEELSLQDMMELVEELEPDDQAYLVSLLPEDSQDQVRKKMERRDPDSSQVLLAEKNTAGSIMTTEYVQVGESTTVEAAIEAIRSAKEEEEDVFYLYVYVTDEHRKLKGVVSLGELLHHKPVSDPVRMIMNSEVFVAGCELDQEEAAHLVETYNLLALPVVNHDQEMIGIITVDDVIDVLEAEAEEDMLRFSGIGLEAQPSQESLLKSVNNRFPWLFAATIGGVLCMIVIRNFEAALSQWWFLAIFIPAINGISGNVGVQASVIVIRGITTGSINPSRVPAFLFRQVMIGSLLGLIFGVLIAGTTMLLFSGPQLLPLVVGSALVLSIFTSTCIGVFLPFVFHRFGIDPALSASPLVLSLVDISAVSIFFLSATWILIGQTT